MSSGPEALTDHLGHTFDDPSLLETAITHRSWCAENPGTTANERLEFLGDSVLGLAVTDHLYARFPGAPEGELTKMRAAVVSAPVLADVAAELDLGAHLRLGKGESASGGRTRSSILSDALEAVIGAVYLDGGWPAARALVLRMLAERIESVAALPGVDDHKTRLQELVAQRFGSAPSYQLSERGPDHDKRFSAAVTIEGRVWGRGGGSSKKQAEQEAARVAWQRLVADDDPGSTPEPEADRRRA